MKILLAAVLLLVAVFAGFIALGLGFDLLGKVGDMKPLEIAVFVALTASIIKSVLKKH